VSDVDPRERTHLLELLLDLASDASSYLRRNANRAVRVSAALLVAASLAACNGSPLPPLPGRPGDAVQPLSREVRAGLPSQPGRYPIVEGSVRRDAQGIYSFQWLSGGTPNSASASRLRLAQSDTSLLEVPASGDPTLYLPSQTTIPLGGGGGGGYYGSWLPFTGISSRTPSYYDPPSQAVAQGATVSGARISSAPAPAGERTVGLPHTVSGRAGGTGSGVAASTKSGAGTTSGTGKGVSAAKSGGFSSGTGGGKGGSSS
jgi:hypothetical protein